MAKIAKNVNVGVIIGSTDTQFTGAQDVSISGPSVATYETTSHGTGNAREFIGGLIDYGDVSFTCYPNEADLNNAATAIGYCNANLTNTLTFYVEQTGGRRLEFSGIVTDLSESHPVDGLFSVSVSIKRSGEITETT